MKREAFLKTLGKGACFTLVMGCFGSCAQENIQPDGFNGTIDFTLDLNDAQNASLNSNGGFVVVNGSVVVARTNQGEYVAATRTCSHEPRNEIILRDGEWFCTAHSARFSLNGSGLNSKGRNGLTIFNTELTSNLLRVFAA